ncbi:MAG: SMP-30/gluconolactonase/LRE family protein [candidate division Zixibacteria bacterium]
MIKNIMYMAGLVVLALPLLSHSQQFYGPESAVYDMPRERYLISNYSNGQIIAMDLNGQRSVFAQGKNSSAGLHIIDDTVYVGCGGQGVLAYNLVTGEEVMDLLIPGSILLNDVTSDTSGNLYVSDPYGNKIYRIQMDDRSYSVLVDYIYWPNGLLFDKINNRLLACKSTTYRIYSVNMSDGSLTELVNVGGGHLDGLAEDNTGNIYVSSQGPEAVYRYNNDFTSYRELVSSGHSGPADIYYNKWLEVLVVPNISNSTVDFIDMPNSFSLIEYNFSDDTYGDGDGILEGEEEIELTFTFENTKPVSVVNTFANLYCEDISLIVNNGSVDFGELAPEEVADNASSPLRFTIPADYKPRIDSFYIEISYSFIESERTDTFVILQGMGFPDILLVDDFAGGEISEYYKRELDNLLIPYILRDVQSEGIPQLSILNEYEVVVWFTGNDGADSFNSEKISSLRGYMDGGGNLFLTGQGITANINLLDVGFLNDYLKCEHISPLYIAMLNNAPTSQVFTEGDTLIISMGDGAPGQTNTDHISALNGGVEEFNYITTSNCAAISFNGVYKLVLFGFGFEAISSSDSRYLTRKNTLMNILSFFEFEYPNSTPTASNLIIEPGDPTHMIDHAPEISWMYVDDEMSPQAYYQVQTGDDDDWLVCEMWDSGPVSGSEISVSYSGIELIDGEDYYIRVRLSDGTLWSDWIYGTFHMNSVPIPINLTPNNSEEFDVNPPILSHATMTDIEGDALFYDYQLYDDIAMTELVDEASGLDGGPGDNTTWSAGPVLIEYEDYYWRVRCRDIYETGVWSELASFILIPAYKCGDANSDEEANVGDAVFIINHVFKGGPAPDPLDAGDANCDGQCNVGDAVYLINHVFKGGPAPCQLCE